MRIIERVLNLWMGMHPRWRVVVVAVPLLGFGAASVAGYRQWHYMQHDNRFCTTCHLMQDPYDRFTRSAHAALECHSCHKSRPIAQMRQLYLTLVEEPREIAHHADVPNEICGSCHIQGDSTRWRIIANTAGHRVHLESQALALRETRCVLCHGVSVHEFASVDRTCGQAGCHSTNQIVLGRMGEVSELHCVTCHSFLADARGVQVDSLGRPLTPAASQCLGCHEMQEAGIRGLDVARDPHRGVCGSCHNPHRQTESYQVTCTSGACHSGWQQISFHVGVPHPERCVGCHEPHQWRVEGENCLRCHAQIDREPPTRTGPGRRADASRSGAAGPVALASLRWSGAAGRGPASLQDPSRPRFSHGDHRGQQCSSCHSSRVRHGELLVRSAGDCQRCHHSGPARERCEACHRDVSARRSAPNPRTFQLRAGGGTSVARSIRFDHQLHAAVACTACHTDPLSRAPAGGECGNCHAPHHDSDSNCMTCHGEANAIASHSIQQHGSCASADCHGQRAASLPLSRETCLVCHASLQTHQAGKLCNQCHQVVRGGSSGD